MLSALDNVKYQQMHRLLCHAANYTETRTSKTAISRFSLHNILVYM